MERDYPDNLIDTLAEAGRSIASTGSDEEELAEITYVEAARLCETDFFQMGIFEDSHYRTLIWIKDNDRVENVSFELSPDKSGIVGWVRESGETVLVSDFEVEKDILPAQPSYDAEDAPRSGMFVPLKLGESVIGIISIQSRRPGAFDLTHSHLIEVLSSYVAPVMLNIRLRLETEYLTIHTVITQEVSRHLLSLDPIHDRLERVISLLCQAFGFEFVDLYENVDDEILLRASSRSTSDQPDEYSMATFASEAIANQDMIIRSIEGHDEPLTGESSGLCYSIPLMIQNRVLGVLGIYCHRTQDSIEDHLSLIRMLATQMGFAILESRNYTQHQEEAWITTVLLEVARHAAQPGDSMVALEAVLQLATILAGTNWAMLLVPEEGSSDLVVGPAAGLRRQDLMLLSENHISPDYFGSSPKMEESDEPYLVSLPAYLAEVLGSDLAACMVLSDSKSLLGVLLFEDHPLSQRRVSLLVGIAHQISLRIENTRLIEEAGYRHSLERELVMARDIQASFLPRDVPVYPGWEVGVTWRSAREVGGDFYDFIPLPEGPHGKRWGVIIADVSDKGIPAALYMALCRTLIRTVASDKISPAESLERVNHLLLRDTRADLFVSMFYCVWEPQIDRITYANAGHNPPLVLTPGYASKLVDKHGIVLGVENGAKYSDHSITLDTDQMLVLYTDGITEAFNSSGEMFGLHRLENLILGSRNWQAQTVADRIRDRVLNFSGVGDISDDLTAIALRRTLT